MTYIVEKIGGTSMSRLSEFRDTLFIRNGAPRYGRYFVVSAFGGITNLLLEHKKSGEPGVYARFDRGSDDCGWRDALRRTSDAMIAAHESILDHPDDIKTATAFVQDRIRGAHNCLTDLKRLCFYGSFRLSENMLRIRELLAGLGEAHSAYAATLMLCRSGMKACFVDLSGWCDKADLTLEERIATAIEDIDPTWELPGITGYAQCREGLMNAYDRGYSEVTFSRLAAMIGAREAVIRKEFHLSSADPILVGAENARKIGHTNYDIADQMANLGMEAIHPAAARILRRAKVPLRVTNVFEPDDPGTLIDRRRAEKPAVEVVTGLDVVALEVFEQDAMGSKGFDAAILEAIERHDVRIVSKTMNANTITHFLDAAGDAVRLVANDLSDLYPNARISIRALTLVSVLGRDLTGLSVTARSLQALSEAGLTPLGIVQGPRCVETQFILEAGYLATGILSLHAWCRPPFQGGAVLRQNRHGSAMAATAIPSVYPIQIPAAPLPRTRPVTYATGRATGQ
ncbi:MAG: aspartate kinase [Pseudomonadota bacterium]